MNSKPQGRGLARKTLHLIAECQDILAVIQPASVRAVCYRLFVKKLIPDMSKRSTNRVSRVLTTAREEGFIPWEWIVDENRDLETVAQWSSPEHFMDNVTRQFRRDYWSDQPFRIELWSEKGTMRGMLQPVLSRYGIGFRVMHGYSSATVINDVAEDTQRSEQQLVVFYLGDWDPSGLHMSRVDLPTRLGEYGATLNFQRIALTEYDIHTPEIASTSFSVHSKKGDTRYRWFLDNVGDRCWEVDAMNPVDIRNRVEEHVTSLIDPEEWARHIEVQSVETQSIREVIDVWNDLKRGA